MLEVNRTEFEKVVNTMNAEHEAAFRAASIASAAQLNELESLLQAARKEKAAAQADAAQLREELAHKGPSAATSEVCVHSAP